MALNYSYRHIFLLLLLLFILFIIILLLAYYFLGISPSETGPFGDTVGGLFSPVVGLASIYLVLKAYKEQKSSTFYLDFSKNIDELRTDVTDLIIQDDNVGNISGLESINQYHKRIHSIFRDNKHSQHNTNFLKKCLTIFEKSASLYDRYSTLKSMLINEHSKDFEQKFNLFVKIYLIALAELFEYYKFHMKDFIVSNKYDTIQSGIPGDQTIKLRAVEIVKILEQYQSAMNIFIKYKIAQPNKSKEFVLFNTLIDKEKILSEVDFNLYDFKVR